jgi:hypothetical protein
VTVGDRTTYVDGRALREGRLSRLQGAMRKHGVEACILFNPANVRYATGATTMTVYCLGSFVRCAVVAADGRAVLFEHPNSMHLFADIEADVRPFHAWEFFDDPDAEAVIWAAETAAALRERGITGGPVAVDKIAPVAQRALEREGYEVIESGTVTMDARAVKTPEEIALFRATGALTMDVLAAFEAAVAPGVSEQDLIAVITDALLRGGGEYLITRGVASGLNTNPWRQEATDRAMEPGDLVFVDTDLNGIEGSFLLRVAHVHLRGRRAERRAARHVSHRAGVARVDAGTARAGDGLPRPRRTRASAPGALHRPALRDGDAQLRPGGRGTERLLRRRDPAEPRPGARVRDGGGHRGLPR